MILPESRKQFTAKKQKRDLGKKILVPVVLIALVAVVIWQWTHIKSLFTQDTEPAGSLDVLWEGQRYEEINALCEQLLAEDPLRINALLYNGFSYFYRGVNQFSFEEKIALFDRCVANLRKAILFDLGETRGRAFYVLGKAYYYKGKYYADLTIEYLQAAEEHGYVGDDSYEYLGLAYTILGDYEKSAESFLKAVTHEPTDIRYLALAQAYFNQGLADRSEEYLLRTLNKTEDPAVEERTRFLLGKIYMETEQLAKAEDQYKRILDKDPDSADAYFFLGEIYLKYKRDTEARYYWRRAHMIDASHYGARLRLF